MTCWISDNPNRKPSALMPSSPETETPLGGSWGVISGVISKVTIVITHIRGLITPLIATLEPPNSGSGRLIAKDQFGRLLDFTAEALRAVQRRADDIVVFNGRDA